VEETGEGRVLRKVIRTLVTGGGENVELDVYLISDKMPAVVVALIEARERGLYSEEDRWR